MSQSLAPDLSAGSDELLASVVEGTGDVPGAQSMADLGEGVERLSGGVDAATYLLRAPGTHVVVKLAESRLEAEARALRAWWDHTHQVPEVLGSGVVPSTAEAERPVRYLVLGVLLDERGELVTTAAEHLEQAPGDAHAVGRALGAELERLHRAVGPGGFGDFADSPGAERTYDSWAGYLADYWDHQAEFVRDGLGVAEGLRRAVHEQVAGCQFDGRGRYLHGDASIRNTAVYATDPVRVGLFDPNPVIGDPTWDLAPFVNNAAIDRRRARRGDAPERCSDDLLAGVTEGYGERVADDSLLVARLVQAVMQAEHRVAASRSGELDPVDAEVACELVHDLLQELCG